MIGNKRFIVLPTAALFVAVFSPHSWAAGEDTDSPGRSCSIYADQSTTRLWCPVLVEMALKNSGDSAVVLKQPISDKFGTATVEVRAPGATDFVAVRTGYSGVKGFFNYRSELAPGETYVAHVLLLCDRDGKWVFSDAGRYELRARIRFSDGEAVSSPIEIDVQAQDATVAEKLSGTREDLRHVSLDEALDPERIERIAKVVAKLPEYRNALQWVQATAYTNLKDTAAQQALTGKLEAFRESLAASSVWRNLLTATLARRYAEGAEDAKAEKLLAELKHRSELVDKARLAIQQRRASTSAP
jgi:hypothetical protein